MIPRIKSFYRIFFGVLIFVAIFYQLYYLRNSPTYNLINYVSYFTVLSNFFVASVLIFSAIRYQKSYHLDFARGAATLYILVTGFGFIFLLGGKNEQLLPWVNIVLHYIAPIVMILDWVFDSIQEKIKLSKAIFWIVPSFTYLGYLMLRGYFVNWYPYDFLDPNITPPSDMLKYFFYILIGMLILTVTLNEIKRINI